MTERQEKLYWREWAAVRAAWPDANRHELHARALGKDKAKRGFKDTRDRLFGKDVALLQAPEIATRLPKV